GGEPVGDGDAAFELDQFPRDPQWVPEWMAVSRGKLRGKQGIAISFLLRSGKKRCGAYVNIFIFYWKIAILNGPVKRSRPSNH
ncbi:MAG: hypothetical protein ACFNKE_10025, partial [Neisseria elongata]